jgi:hypothetical protein
MNYTGEFALEVIESICDRARILIEEGSVRQASANMRVSWAERVFEFLCEIVASLPLLWTEWMGNTLLLIIILL